MLIYVDGPEKAGKTTLVGAAAEGFAENRHEVVKQTGRDTAGGMGYLKQFLSHIDSDNIYLWDRGWVSEVVYGKLLDDGRPFAEDPFLCEWMYGRPLIGRGGRFVLTPYDPEILFDLRDGSDLPVNPIREHELYESHGDDYGYQVLVNDYDPDSLTRNILTVRKSGLVGLHRLDSTQFIGPRRPFMTFIGKPVGHSSGTTARPFYSPKMAEYFRPYGLLAINEFGYTTPETFETYHKQFPQLFKRPVLVGEKLSYRFPYLPVVPYSRGYPTEDRIEEFKNGVAEAMRRYHV